MERDTMDGKLEGEKAEKKEKDCETGQMKADKIVEDPVETEKKEADDTETGDVTGTDMKTNDVTEADTKADKAEAPADTEKDKPEGDFPESRKAEAGGSGIKKKRPVIRYLLLCVLAVLLIAYGCVAVYYRSHFFPATTINGYDCSNQTVESAALLLENQAQEYVLTVTGRMNESGDKGELGEIRAGEIDLRLEDAASTAERLLKEQNCLLWILAYFQQEHSYSVVNGVVFDEELLEEQLKQWDSFQRKNMIQPQDAYISEYSEKEECYLLVPETKGTALDMADVSEKVKNAVYAHAKQLDLEEQGCYQSAAVTTEDKKLKENLAKANLWLTTAVTYDWNGTEVAVDKDLIREWIVFEKSKPSLDEEAVARFVSDTAKELDTYGKKRKFTTTLGVELTLPSGAYGWKTDREGETEELLQLILQGSILKKEPLYLMRAAQKGSNDIGPSYVEADLSNQHLYLYQNGELVLETDFVSGSMNRSGRMTPPGVFGLTYKTTNAVLRGEDYETPVNYWMPFNGNVGMHDATWRASFGGEIFLTNGSHGCINLPLNMAKEIYQYVSTGFPVICYYY